MTTPLIPMLFVAVTATVGSAALALLIRDLRLRAAAGRGIGHSAGVPSPFDTPARRLKTSPRQMDRAFVELLESAGAKIDVITALTVVLAGGIVGFAAPLFLFDSMMGAAGGLIVGATIPIAAWSVQRTLRMAKMAKHLPQALEAMADCVRNGHGLESATGEVACEVPEPLAGEFLQCASQLRLGHSPTAVMEAAARRVPLPEFRVFATAAVVHQQTGGNLAMLAERLAASALDRREAMEHLTAVSSGSRLSAIGLVAGALTGVAILAWIRPEYLEILWYHPLGTALIAISLTLLLAGSLWIWRVLKINY